MCFVSWFVYFIPCILYCVCMFALIFQRLLLEAVFDLIYFPLWWYTRGAVHAFSWCVELLSNGNSSLGPGLWLKNIFVPMFGQSDWEGRIVSFFMRLINVIGRGIALLVWLIFCFVLFLIWLAIPVVMIATIILSFKN